MNKGRNKGRKSKKLAAEYLAQSSFDAGVKREQHEHGPWVVRNGRDCCTTCPYVDKRYRKPKTAPSSMAEKVADAFRVPRTMVVQPEDLGSSLRPLDYIDTDRPLPLPKRVPGASLERFVPPSPIEVQPSEVIDAVKTLGTLVPATETPGNDILQSVKDGIENIPPGMKAEPVLLVTSSHMEGDVKVIDSVEVQSVGVVKDTLDPDVDRAGFIRYMCTDSRDGIWIDVDSQMRRQELWDRVYRLIHDAGLQFHLVKKTTRGELIAFIQSLKSEWSA